MNRRKEMVRKLPSLVCGGPLSVLQVLIEDGIFDEAALLVPVILGLGASQFALSHLPELVSL